jgi:hypothetical protein
MRSSSLPALAMASALAACQTLPPGPSAAIFRDPASYAGQEVRVCGYLEDTSNINEAKGRFKRGLSLEGDGPALLQRVRDRRHRTCLVGKVRRFGCGEEQICLEWAYPWGIAVSRVEPD